MSFVYKFLQFLDCVKVHHWQTRSYARHKATDELHKNMSKLIDDFVETYYGIHNDRPYVDPDRDVITLESLDDKEMDQSLQDFVTFLETDIDSMISQNLDLKTIRDEMIAQVHHALYLMSFS